MIGSNRVPGVPPPCNSVTGSTDLSYRLVHNNTQQPELEILTGDWPVYSPPHTDEAKRGGGLLELGEGECWQFGREGKQKAYSYICSGTYMKWPSPVGESCSRQVGPGGL